MLGRVVGSVAATVLALTGVVVVAPASDASVPILYMCKNTHLNGWTEVIYTHDLSRVYWLRGALGYSCYCVAG